MDSINEMLGLSVDSTLFRDIGLALLALIAALVAGRLAQIVFRRLLERLPPATLRHGVVDAASLPVVWALRLAGVWAGLEVFARTGHFEPGGAISTVYMATTVGLATWLGVRIIGEATGLWAARASGTADTFDDQLVPVVRKTAKALLVSVGGVMILQNLGYSVSSLLAGLGIGTAAVAFASKDTIANFFGSLVVFVDRPFQVGDWVEIGDVEGTVEEVDIRTTRIRTFANSLISVPNSKMTVTEIQNWSRMKKRRIKLEVGLTYDTTPAQMRDAVAAIREIIAGDDRFHHDFFLVNFHEMSESSLNIFCYLFTRTTNWAEYMQVRQDFLLAVMDAVQGLGLQIAFPTRTLHFAGTQPPGAPDAMLRQTPR
ncbi:MAG: mechanosensitive ion channel family protein [Nannocystaceae bacterium]